MLTDTLTDLCQEIRNWFDLEKHFGNYEIVGGSLAADFLADGQYFRIVGSVFNDGIHQYPATDLTDESFTGAVWALAIPKAVINLSTAIEEWRDKYEGVDSAAMSPYASESFGGYSYSKAGSSAGGGSSVSGWQSVFALRLNKWRKL